MLLSAARLGPLSPFALAFFFSALHSHVSVSAAVAFGTVAGAALWDPARGPVVLAAVTAGWALLGPRGAPSLRGMRPVAAAMSLAAARLVASGFGWGRPPLWWIEGTIEATLAAALVALWMPAFESQREPARTPRSEPSRAAGLLAWLAAILLGLASFGAGPLQPAGVAGPLSSLLVTAARGPALGVGAAVVPGFVLALGQPRWLLFAVVQSVAAVAAAFAPGRRPWSALALVSAAGAAGLAASSAEWVAWALVHTGVAAAIYTLLPGGWIASLERRVHALVGEGPGAGGGWMVPSPSQAQEHGLALRWVSRRASARMESAARVLEALRSAYESAASAAPSDVDSASEHVQMIQRRACERCPSAAHCWEAHASATFWDMVSLLEHAERSPGVAEEDMPAALRQRCIQPVRLVAAVNDVAAISRQVRRAVEHAAAASRRLLSEIDATRRILRTVVARDEREGLPLDGEGAARLARHLARAGLTPREVLVVGTGARREIAVRLSRRCREPGQCRQRVAELVQEVEGVPLLVTGGTCSVEAGDRPDAGCEVYVSRKGSWSIDCAFHSRTHPDRICSGDSFRRLDLLPGVVAVILSDGMGTGPEAARESASAVELATAALSAGLPPASAIRVANDVLLARAADERFATLDVAAFDLVAGELELAKAGAYPTFLFRSGNVERLEGRAVPAGIVDAVEVTPERRALADGDVVVMTTDGACELGTVGEACLEQVLGTVGPVAGSSEELLRAIVECLDRVAGDSPVDDVTVAVVTARQLDATGLPSYTGSRSANGSRRPAAAFAVGRQRQRRLSRGAQPFGDEGG